MPEMGVSVWTKNYGIDGDVDVTCDMRREAKEINIV